MLMSHQAVAALGISRGFGNSRNVDKGDTSTSNVSIADSSSYGRRRPRVRRNGGDSDIEDTRIALLEPRRRSPTSLMQAMT